MAQVSRVAPLEFKASLFPWNDTRFSPVGDPNLGHSLLKCPMAPQWKHPCLCPFLGDGLRDCALYLSIRFLFTSSIMAAIWVESAAMLDFISLIPLCRQYFSHFFLQTLICNPISPYCAHPGLSPVVRPWRYLFHLPSRITPKGDPKYSLIIMLEPPHFINSLLYVFRSDIRGITPGLFICCPLA